MTGKMIISLAFFAIAMAYAEAAVVVYLRELYYPQGFSFPLGILPPSIYATEVGREAATIVMLLSVAVVAGRNRSQRVAAFLITFGLWDIVYYLWLRFLIDWPPSLMTWDILFLIPVIWAGPVLAPVLCSLTMLVMAACILRDDARGPEQANTAAVGIPVLVGAVFILFSFVRDYGLIVLQELSRGGFSADRLQQRVSRYMPGNFSWGVFLLGNFIVLGAVVLRCRKWRG